MELTPTQIDDFKNALVDELSCHLYDFIKNTAAEIADFDGDYHSIRQQLIDISDDLVISFNV